MAGATAAAGAAGVGSLIGEATSGIALAVSAESEVAVRSCCLSPLDLLPFCRVPLLVVVESDASHAFASFATVAARPSGFHRPLVCLLAPCPPPDAPRKAKAQLASLTQLAGGGALSLFLHDPIGAFCALGGVKVTSTSTHDKCLKLLLAAFSELTKLLVESADTPPDILAFLQVERPAN